MKSIYILILCCIANITDAAAQRNYAYQKGKMLDSLKRVYSFNPDKRITIRKDLLKQSKKNKDDELRAFAELMALSYKGEGGKAVDQPREEIGEKYKAYPNIQARAYQIQGYHYFIGNVNYEKAFDAYLKLEKLLEIYGPQVITDYANYCAEMASAYYKFGNHKKAIVLGKKGVVYASNQWDFYNTIGLCYRELHQIDSSIYYLQKAVEVAVYKKLPDIYRTISLGNIGYNYYLQNKYNKAKPLIQMDLNGALRIRDNGLAAGAAIPLAAIYLSEKDWRAADTLLNQARNHISLSKQLDRLEKFFPVRSRYYELRGMPMLALAYRDSAIRAIKRNDSVFNGLLVMRVQQRNDMEKLAEEKNNLENYKKVSQTRLLSLGIVFVMIVIVFLIVRRYRDHRERDKKRIEELKRIIELRQRLSADMHDDIGSTLSSISIYTHSLLMKSQELDQKNTLEKIKQNAQNVQESISDIIWSVNPQMDSMEQVLSRMRSFGADMAEYAGIDFDFDTDEQAGTWILDMVTRKNLYLIYKEAINNAVKYSGCKKITVCLKSDRQDFTMQIADDGLGFDTSQKYMGNGLPNMQRRANEVNARLTISSYLQGGTVLLLRIGTQSNS